ncbi:MAG: hypothetical protein ACR2NI_08255 [Pirellulales bacterium]
MFLGGCPCCGKKECWRCYEFGGCDRDWILSIIQKLDAGGPPGTDIEPCRDYPPIIVDCSYETTSNNEGLVIYNPGQPQENWVYFYRAVSFERMEVKFIPIDRGAFGGPGSGVATFHWTYIPDPAQFGFDGILCPEDLNNVDTFFEKRYQPSLYMAGQRNSYGYFNLLQRFSVGVDNLNGEGSTTDSSISIDCEKLSSESGFGVLGAEFSANVNLAVRTSAISTLTHGTASVRGSYPDWVIEYGEDNVLQWEAPDHPFDSSLKMYAQTEGLGGPPFFDQTYESTFTVYSARLEDGTDIVPGGLGE